MARPQDRTKVERPAASPPAPGEPAGTTLVSSGQAPDLPDPSDPAFFERAVTYVKTLPTRNIIVTVPMWGWTGDGKTCALLTAVHYSRAASHALSFPLVTDVDDLHALQAAVPQYADMDLRSVADSTKARFSELSELFIDNRRWLPGTNEVAPYLFRVTAINRPLAYVYVPDLRGGSHREVDEISRAVGKTAQAYVVLVNPDVYADLGVDARRYREEVGTRIRRCIQAGIPTAILVTKADSFGKTPTPTDHIDKTYQELANLVAQLDDGPARALVRVSVLGAAQPSAPPPAVASDLLPEENQRNPDQLLRAWVWTILHALRAVAGAECPIPPIRLRELAEDARGVQQRKLGPEGRVIDHLTLGGQVLTLDDSDARDAARVLALQPDGKLVEEEVGAAAAANSTRERGSLNDASALPADSSAIVLDGHILVGAARNADRLWRGRLGNTVPVANLPCTCTSWYPVSHSRVVALDAAGRLLLLLLDGVRWTIRDHIADFVPANSPNAVVGVLTSQPIVAIAASGADVYVVQIEAEQFGTRVSIAAKPIFDTARVVLNRQGCFVAVKADGVAIATLGAKTHNLGPAHETSPIGLSSEANVGTFVAKDNRIRVFRVADTQALVSEPSLSPLLELLPQRLVMSTRGRYVLACHAERTTLIKLVGV